MNQAKEVRFVGLDVAEIARVDSGGLDGELFSDVLERAVVGEHPSGERGAERGAFFDVGEHKSLLGTKGGEQRAIDLVLREPAFDEYRRSFVHTAGIEGFARGERETEVQCGVIALPQ